MSTIKSSAENLTLNADGANNDIKFQSNGSEVASIDQAGLLTATTFSSSVSQNVSALFNRTSNDGGVVSLRKNGSEVGNLGCRDGFLTIYSGDTGLGFADDHIRGMTSTGSRDNAIDLGRAATRFKDLYLSGGLKVGGTGAANTLDDYEQGTWTPAPDGGMSGLTKTDCFYTKIGNTVFIQGRVSGFTGINSATLLFGGLPFNPEYSSSLGTVGTTFVDLDQGYQLWLHLSHGDDRLAIRYMKDNAQYASLAGSDVSSSSNIHFTATYTVA